MIAVFENETRFLSSRHVEWWRRRTSTMAILVQEVSLRGSELKAALTAGVATALRIILAHFLNANSVLLGPSWVSND